MIELRGVSKSFAGPSRRAPAVVAVQDLSWQAPSACITGLLGPNGAGKTTTLRLLAGLLRPDAGAIDVAGINVLDQPERARARLGLLSDARGLYPRLSARENIIYHGQLQGLSRADANARAELLARQLDMLPLLDRRTAGFSQGERMKTALARALVHGPSHLVLDEPSNGLDVPATRSLRAVLQRLRDEQGCCIVLSSHVMQEVERLCDRLVVMAAGHTAAQGTLPELMARTGSSDVEACYLALAHPTAAPHAPRRTAGPDGVVCWIGPAETPAPGEAPSAGAAGRTR